VLAVYFGGCTVYAVKHGMWVCVPFLYLFVQGYAYMAALSLVPALSEMRGRHAVGESPGPAAAGG
jgi:hypothetical protein